MQKQTRVPTNPGTLGKALDEMGFKNIPVRFFIFDSDEGEEGDIRECNESEFLGYHGTLSYERHTVFTNGVSQICLTKI